MEKWIYLEPLKSDPGRSNFHYSFSGQYFWERALLFVKQMSKKAFCSYLHSVLTLISHLPSSPIKPFNPSFSIFCSFGAVSALFRIVFIIFASKSQTLLHVIITKPSFFFAVYWMNYVIILTTRALARHSFCSNLNFLHL